ncbi:arylamine N-acetyltransferase family protein [Salidesulfovibrio onnuriiensis]|uniref:arylamine N-acetyltransferase family protein n=1 Tax=Salidesulfovibrio onnuriiensis TaxID=2583823 RepID=UPI0011CBDAD4|nr:arylamine N-acetyltransferase [Salidesulfovibrio onnuriiensis]
MDTFDSAAYLRKLNLSDPVEPTVDTLRALQHAQFHTIPFENFDIHLGRGVDLDPEHQFDKLVHLPRGGYCFELNGLFLRALRAFGFEARALLARVHLTGTPSGRGHQISLIETDGRQWIADVGFGKDTPRGPMPLELGAVRKFNGVEYRLGDGGVFGTMLQKFTEGEWRNLYSFDMEHVCPADIDYGNHYVSTSPRTFFTQARVAMRPLEDGMITLYNHRLTVTRHNREEKHELPEGQGYLDALKTHFGIELDAPYAALKPVAREG